MSNKKLYDFAGFRLDTDQKCLWRDEELVSLTPKAYDTLQVLIKNNGRVITKNEILDEVWENTFVEEATLAQNISTLRKTLAKYDKEKDFIVTIPRRGYRFVAEVTEINSEEEELILEKRTVTHIVAEQKEIHESADSKEAAIQVKEDVLSDANEFSFKKKLLVALPIMAVVLGAIGFAFSSYFSRSGDFYSTKFQKFRVNTLFSGENISEVVASPDGKYIAVIERNPKGDTLSLKQTKDGNTLEVLPKSDLNILGATFASSGEYIYYSAYKKGQLATGTIGKLYRVPLLGGASQEVIEDIDSRVAVSKDGQKFVFLRNKIKEKQSALMISNADGSDMKELKVIDFPNMFSPYGTSWSPESKVITAVISNRENKETPVNMIAINVETGEEKPLASKDWLWIGRTSWLEDGSGVTFVGYGTKSPNLTDEIWVASYPEGKLRSITNGIRGVSGLTVSNNSDSIIATKMTRIKSTFVGDIGDLNNSNEIAKTSGEESLLPLGSSWIGEEKIVYSRTKNGDADIWVMNPDGSKPKQLTSGEGADYYPAVSPDGDSIYFLSNRKGELGIWRMDLDGQNQEKIIQLQNMLQPFFSLSEDGIYFLAKAPNQFYRVLWKTDLNGKNLLQVTKKFTAAPKISPDGKFAFCIYPQADSKTTSPGQSLYQTIVSTETGEVIKQFDKLVSFKAPVAVWKPDNSGLLVADGSKLSFRDASGEKQQVLKEWDNGKIYQMSISKSGEKVFFEKGEEVVNVVELRDETGEE